jgi:hypothetical protein
MRRRAFLASAGLAALAGCSNGDGSAGDGSTATPTSPTSTGTASGEPEFELRGAKFPDARALNNPTTFAIGVRNAGTASGTFTSALETKVGDGEWTTAGEIEMPLEPGETGEWHSPRFVPQYLTTLHYRLAAFDETWSIEVVPKRLDFSNFYAVPNELYITVLGGSFEAEYPTATNETATDGTNGTATDGPTPTPTTPADGGIWAVMRVDVRNRRQESQVAPPASSFVLEADGERRPQHQEVTDAPYEGGELAGRTVRRGDLVYAVPAGTRARDLRMTWEQSFPEGDVKAIWTK